MLQGKEMPVSIRRLFLLFPERFTGWKTSDDIFPLTAGSSVHPNMRLSNDFAEPFRSAHESVHY